MGALRPLIPEEVTIEVTIPDQEAFGHYSTNVAFKLAKTRGTSPITIAEDIIKKISINPLFSRVELKAPGFINIWIQDIEYYKELDKILLEKETYGKKIGKKNKKIQIEYVSANPTGPLTLANGRGGFLGDALSNVLDSQGFDVEREYYVNDTGNQVVTLGKSLVANCGHIPFEETFYKGEYVAEWAQEHKEFIEKHKDDPEHVGRAAADYFLSLIQEALEKKAKIHFDRYTSEQKDIHDKKYVEKVLDVLKTKNVVYEADGATWFKTTEFDDDKDRVLITSKKTPTYLLADAGHYLETKERGFYGKVLILGPDHYGYVARIQAVAKILGLEDSRVIITQAVRLLKGGEEMKMSKRKGAFVTFGELIDEVGVDVARFFFLMISPDSHMDFDIDLAREHSNKNPVFYLQYAFVRASSILQKTECGVCSDYAPLATPEDTLLMRKLSEFPDILEEVGITFSVHRITQYAGELSRAFHNFYEKEHVDGVEEKTMRARRALVEASQHVLGNTLRILGCSTPEKM